MSTLSPPSQGATLAHHLISLRVENRSGVLSRVAGLFSRRGFNIVSLAVAPTEDERFSRIAIVVDAESAPLAQIMNQLDKLINVVEITQLDPSDALEVELMLATVAKGDSKGAKLEELVSTRGGTIMETGEDAATVMLAAAPEVLDELAERLDEHGIIALQRTGRIALPKLT